MSALRWLFVGEGLRVGTLDGWTLSAARVDAMRGPGEGRAWPVWTCVLTHPDRPSVAAQQVTQHLADEPGGDVWPIVARELVHNAEKAAAERS